MGRRKSKRKPMKKRKFPGKLDQIFVCPFCGRERSCDTKLDRIRKVGFIQCSICKESFKTQIISLSEPIDVYNDWIDACESLN